MFLSRPMHLVFIVALGLCVVVGCDRETEDAEPVAVSETPSKTDPDGASATGAARPPSTPPPSQEPPADDPEEPTDAPPTSGDELAEKIEWESCDELKDNIQADIDELPRSCESDSDCTRKSFGCPFGCGEIFAASADLDEIHARLSEFQGRGRCTRCRYRCMPPSEPVCRRGRCVKGS